MCLGSMYADTRRYANSELLIAHSFRNLTVYVKEGKTLYYHETTPTSEAAVLAEMGQYLINHRISEVKEMPLSTEKEVFSIINCIAKNIPNPDVQFGYVLLHDAAYPTDTLLAVNSVTNYVLAGMGTKTRARWEALLRQSGAKVRTLALGDVLVLD